MATLVRGPVLAALALSGCGDHLVDSQYEGDPVFSMFFKYASEGLQSGMEDPALDKMIASAPKKSLSNNWA